MLDQHLEKVRWIYHKESSSVEYITSKRQFYHYHIFRYDFFFFLESNSLLPMIPNSRILDIGCGTGFTSRMLLDFGMKPTRYHGIEVVKSYLEAQKAVVPHANYCNASATELPFHSNTFDIILCFRIMTSIHEERLRTHIVNEAIRVLKTGGVIIYWDVCPPPLIYKMIVGLYCKFKKNKKEKYTNVSKAKKFHWIKPLKKKDIEVSFAEQNVQIRWLRTGIRHEIINQLLPRAPLLCDVVRRMRISFVNNSIFGLIKLQ